MLKLMMQKMNVDLSQFVMPLSDAYFVEDMTDQFEEELDDIFSTHPRLKQDYSYLQGINRGFKQLAECQKLTKLIPSRPRRVQALKDIKKMKFSKREELFGTHLDQLKSEVDAILTYITVSLLFRQDETPLTRHLSPKNCSRTFHSEIPSLWASQQTPRLRLVPPLKWLICARAAMATT